MKTNETSKGIENQLSEDELINENILYAKRLARRFYRRRSHTQAELDDVVSAAYLGLCEAASRFDNAKAGKFQTYSYLRIVGSMYDYLTTNGGFSRANYKILEGYHQPRYGQTMKVAKDLRELKSFESLIEDWGIKVEVNLKKGSIDLLYSDQKSVDQKIENYQISSKLQMAIGNLNKDVKRVIEAKYFEGKTLSQIAEEFPEYSRSHVSRLIGKGLSDLRRKFKVTLQ